MNTLDRGHCFGHSWQMRSNLWSIIAQLSIKSRAFRSGPFWSFWVTRAWPISTYWDLQDQGHQCHGLALISTAIAECPFFDHWSNYRAQPLSTYQFSDIIRIHPEYRILTSYSEELWDPHKALDNLNVTWHQALNALKSPLTSPQH